MRNWTILLILAPLLCAAMANAAESELEEADAAAGELALPAGAKVLKDVSYGPAAAQRMDTYLPANATRAPALLIVHGGAWRIGDKAASRVMENKAAHWLPEGYVFISINYRMLPDANPLEQADDVARALAAAQREAPQWGGDPARFLLMGHSAGAHLVALLAADPSIARAQGAKPWLGTIALDSAAYDIVSTMNARHYRLYDRAFGKDPDFWRDASPFYRLSAAQAPMLLVCSTRRKTSCDQANAFASKATSLGGMAEVLPLDRSHGEINEALGTPGSYTDSVDVFLRSLGLP